jgi:hypothetical protein
LFAEINFRGGIMEFKRLLSLLMITFLTCGIPKLALGEVACRMALKAGDRFQVTRVRDGLVVRDKGSRQGIHIKLDVDNIAAIVGKIEKTIDGVTFVYVFTEQSIVVLQRNANSSFNVIKENPLSIYIPWKQKPNDKISHFAVSDNGKFIVFGWQATNALGEPIIWAQAQAISVYEMGESKFIKGSINQIKPLAIGDDGKIQLSFR